MGTRILKACLVLAVPLLGGWTYFAEYANNFPFPNCSNLSHLTWTDDQTYGFVTEMNSHGGQRIAVYGNGSFWPNDMREDQMTPSGQDKTYGDLAQFAFIATHGSNDLNTPRFAFDTGLFASNISSCQTFSDAMILGENPGDIYAFVKEGYTNYFIASTCHSIEPADWYDVWHPVSHGLHMVAGYNGESADSWTTDDVGSEFVDDFIGNRMTFFQSWDDAGHDWWADDKPSAYAAGTDVNDAINRLFNETVNDNDVTAPAAGALWLWN